jgi:hypothetical protein
VSWLLKALRVYDIAHVAWRMRVCGDLENAIEKFNKVRCCCVNGIERGVFSVVRRPFTS